MSTVEMIMEELAAGAHEGTVKRYKKIGEVEPYFGATMGHIRKVAKTHKKATELFMPLWRTRNLDAQQCALFIVKPEEVSVDELEECLDDSISINVLDRLVENVLSKRKDAAEWKNKCKSSSSLVKQRLGWSLEARYMMSGEATDKEITAILAEIEQKLVVVPEIVKWTMNRCLVEIAIAYPEWREHVLQLAEQLAVYKEMKVSKGCTSAYAPEWIHAVLKNKK